MKVVDGPDSTAIGPGGAITSGQQDVNAGMATEIEGCVDTPDGSTMTFLYTDTEGASDPAWEPTWIEFASGLPIEQEAFAVEFVGPTDQAGNELLVMATFSDPQGRSFDAHMLRSVFVFDPVDCSDPFDPECADESSSGGVEATESTSGEGESSSGGTAPGSGDDGDGGGGCSCRTRSDAPHWAIFVLALGLGGCRVGRRRHER